MDGGRVVVELDVEDELVEVLVVGAPVDVVGATVLDGLVVPGPEESGNRRRAGAEAEEPRRDRHEKQRPPTHRPLSAAGAENSSRNLRTARATVREPRMLPPPEPNRGQTLD